MDWTHDLIAQLRELWAIDGLSTIEIGKRMGVSKNSIVGKAHRLNLPSRGNPIKRKILYGPPPPPKPPRPQANPKCTLPTLDSVSGAEVIQMPRRLERPKPVVREPPPPKSPKKTIEDFAKLRPKEGCLYPSGDKKPYLICEAPVHGVIKQDGTIHWYSYCHKHYMLCYSRRSDVA